MSEQASLYNFEETDFDLRLKALKEIENDCSRCFKCDLSKSRSKIVFSDGNPKSKVMIIGEGPGKQEDETGIPYVGRAGQLLDKILLSQNITRNDVYICNTVKCRPPENRTPTDGEMAACKVYLDSQIQLIRPKIIILTGSTPVKNILNTKTPISKIRGQWFDGPLGSKIMPIFHPSYLLRNETNEPGKPKWLTWQDIKEIKRAIDALED